MLAKHIGDGQHHVGGGDAFRNGTGKLETDNTRHQHGDRLSKHGRFGFNAANAPTEHAQAIDGGGVRVGAHAGIKIGKSLATVFFDLGMMTLARYSILTWWMMPVPGGTTRKFLNAC